MRDILYAIGDAPTTAKPRVIRNLLVSHLHSRAGTKLRLFGGMIMDLDMNPKQGAQRETEAQEHQEGKLARTIEQQTAKLPSDLFLWAAVGSIVCSAGLQLAGRRQPSLFVGQWAPTFMLLGIYNKIVKVAGSDRVQGKQTFH